jgi:hypothetical protein
MRCTRQASNQWFMLSNDTSAAASVWCIKKKRGGGSTGDATKGVRESCRN